MRRSSPAALSPLTALTALALAGTCGAQAPTLLNTTWTLTGLTDAGQLLSPGRAAPRPTLRLDTRTVSGSTGCNVYRAPYASRGDVLRFGPLATTRRACPDRLDGLEGRFVNLLAQVNRYRLSGDTLTLFAGQSDRLVFRAGGAAAPSSGAEATPTEATMPLSTQLEGPWTLSGGTALRPLPGQAPTLTFAGGRVSGTGGCNRLTGTVQASGDRLTFGPLASTRMLCAPAVNAQEQAFLGVLERPGLRATVRAQVLTLTAADGRTLVFRRGAGAGSSGAGPIGAGPAGAAPVAPVPTSPEAGLEAGVTYTLARVNGQPAPRTVRPVTLSLDGSRLGGSDGCNSFGGDYRLAGPAGQRRLSLTGPLVGTLMACPDVEGAPDLLGVLQARPLLTVTAAGLTLSADGTTLTFARAGAASQARVQTWTVAPQRVPCTGVSPMSCLRIQRGGGSWELFYSDIEGFTFQPGVTQVIRVREEDRPAPVPADASSKRYVLIEVLERR